MLWVVISQAGFTFALSTWDKFNGALTNSSEQVMRGDFSSGWTIRWETPFPSTGDYQNYAQYLITDVDNDGQNEVVASYAKYILAMNGSDGTVEWAFWSVRTGWMITPAVADVDGDDTLEVFADDSSSGAPEVIALKGSDGRLLWRASIPDAIIGSPVVADVDDDGDYEVVVGDIGGTLSIFNATDGTLECSYASGGGIRATPAVDNDKIVFGGAATIYAIDGQCNLIWSRPVGSLFSPPALLDVNGDNVMDVLMGVNNGYLYAFDGSASTVIWSYGMGCPIRGALAVGDVDFDGTKEVVVGDTCGGLAMVDATNGAEEWKITLPYGIYPRGPIGLADFLPTGGLEIVVLVEPEPFSGTDNYAYIVSSSGDTIYRLDGYGDGFAIGDADSDGCIELILECDGCPSENDALFDDVDNLSACGLLAVDDDLAVSEVRPADAWDGEMKVYSADGRYLGREVPRRPGVYMLVGGGKSRLVVVR
ncbi:MAG: PQQ-like beta-propeller repeat protein [Thermotogae bacterium]|nr:PQQ-like beta-propeller repeat protein [Thermotogota bacterium]